MCLRSVSRNTVLEPVAGLGTATDRGRGRLGLGFTRSSTFLLLLLLAWLLLLLLLLWLLSPEFLSTGLSWPGSAGPAVVVVVVGAKVPVGRGGGEARAASLVPWSQWQQQRLQRRPLVSA